MMNHSISAPLLKRQVQRLEHQLGAQMGLHRPAHDPAAENVEHHRQIEEAGPGGDIGYIRYPQTIGRGGAEVALDQIRRRPRLVIAHSGDHPLARLTPQSLAARISRATRLHPTLMPCALSSAWIRGAP